jgi:hypothetical protein
LVLLTDVEAAVTLRFRGLSGRTELRPSDPVPWETHTPRGVGSDSVWQTGDDYARGDYGFSLAYVAYTSEDLEGTTAGLCEFSGVASSTPELAFGPQCAALGRAAGSMVVYQVPPTQERSGRFALAALSIFGENTFPPNITGRHSIGSWVVGRNVRAPRHQAISVTLDSFVGH